MPEKKLRDSNIELFRIVTMLLIVAHHYVVNSGLTTVIGEQPFAVRSLFYLIFGAWGKTGINCFVLITGYYMCKSCLTVRRYVKLLAEVWFYRVILFAVFFLCGKVQISFSSILILLPFSSISDGFTSCFLAFYLFIPFLNPFINSLRQKHHLLLIGLFLLIYTVLAVIPSVPVRINYVSWFIVIYFIGSYLRLYECRFVFYRSGVKLLIVSLLSVASIIGFAFLDSRTDYSLGEVYYFVADVNKPLALATAVFAFAFFHNLQIGFRSWINTIASATFGVLLIHANSEAMRHWLWRDTLNNKGMYGSSLFVLHAVLSVIGVYIVCSGIDLLRIRFIEKPFLRWYDQKEPLFLEKWQCQWKRIQQHLNLSSEKGETK